MYIIAPTRGTIPKYFNLSPEGANSQECDRTSENGLWFVFVLLRRLQVCFAVYFFTKGSFHKFHNYEITTRVRSSVYADGTWH